MTTKYAILQTTYSGDDSPLLDDGVLIRSETNPWIEVGDMPVSWMGHPLSQRRWADHDCDTCAEACALPGVLEAMDNEYGVARCDGCEVYNGDLSAALALAELVQGTVWFEVMPGTEPDVCTPPEGYRWATAEEWELYESDWDTLPELDDALVVRVP